MIQYSSRTYPRPIYGTMIYLLVIEGKNYSPPKKEWMNILSIYIYLYIYIYIYIYISISIYIYLYIFFFEKIDIYIYFDIYSRSIQR